MDDVEFKFAYAGDPETTNNAMELTAMLRAIGAAGRLDMVPAPDVIKIWGDSAYDVNGCNEWLEGWKANGWNRKKPNSPNRVAAEIKNLEQSSAAKRRQCAAECRRAMCCWFCCR
ncbi:MAG: RNase H family protein [Shinella sp.]|uniref:RNase H family protein n=1 Tax=Shinella sp. TaxID=1870904 RepID=UPI004035E29E